MHTSTPRQLGLILAVTTVLVIWCSAAVRAADDATLWEAAVAKVDAGDLAGASSLFAQLINDYPNSSNAPAAQLKLAYIKIRTSADATQEIMDAFSLVRTKYPSSTEAGEALVRIGYLNSKSDAAKAISDFSAFLTSYPSHDLAAEVQQSLGRLYVRTLELDKAEAAFDQVAAISGAPADVVEEAALQSGFVEIMKFYASRDKLHLARAIDAFSVLSSSSRVNVAAKADLGVAEATLLMGNPIEAREKYKAISRKYSGDLYFRGFALYGVALCSQHARDAERAAGDYSTFLSTLTGSTLKEKDDAWKAIALGSVNARAQASVQKDGSWERIPASSIVPKAAYFKGECLYTLARYKEAKQQFEDVLSAFPSGEVAGQAQAALLRCQMAKGEK